LAAKLTHLFQSISQTGLVGSAYIYLPQTQSTNDYCRGLLLQTNQPPEGLVVHAGTQLNGRGQMGNQWLVQPGLNLTFSCVLYPVLLAPADQFYLTMAASLSVLDLLDSYVHGAVLKWPNDIYIEGKKICGILIENNLMGSKIQSSIVGIGLNINQTGFDGLRATSLAMLNGQTYDLEELVRQWCAGMDARYRQLQQSRFFELKTAYLQRMWGLNQGVKYYKNEILHTGVIRGVNALGQLIMFENGTEFYYNFKEVSFVF
jgi:BirA family transcriptional regulator, biotin operon repressor / biotin---[acetyl-CoA-carboxylase] ligase